MILYDVIVIGAGVGGLVSAFELSRQGKKVLLLERQSLPGGYATTFSRKGFVFESAIHCVDALHKGGDIRNYLEDSGLDRKVDFIELKDFSRHIYPQHDFISDFNIEHFIGFLKENFPQEKENIGRLFREINRFAEQFEYFCADKIPAVIKNIIAPLRYPSLVKASFATVNQLLKKHTQDKRLAAIITDIWRFLGVPPSELSLLYFLIVFQGYYCHRAVYIKGGFSKLFQAMIQELQKNGASVKFNTAVTKIITDKGRCVKGIITDKAEEFRAKAIISGANAIDTLTQMVDEEKIKERYRCQLSLLEKSISAVQIYLGLGIPARNLGMNCAIFSVNTTYDHEENYRYSLCGDYDRCSLELVDHSQIDPSLAPQGKGTLLIMTLDAYQNWQGLKQEEYKTKKEIVAAKLISRAEKYLPGLSRYIEVMEVGTPATMQRFSLSPEGAIYGFSPSAKQIWQRRLPQKTLVRGLFLAGAWTRPGPGVHGCFISGIDAANLVNLR